MAKTTLDWGARHILLDGLAAYAGRYDERFGSKIGEDYVLCVHWGDIGALDGGTVEAELDFYAEKEKG